MDKLRRTIRLTRRVCFYIAGFLLVSLYFVAFKQNEESIRNTSMMNSLVSAVNLVEPDRMLKNNMTCIKTKKLLNLYSTTICLHKDSDYVSDTIARDLIWEEDYVTRLLNILIQNPHLDMIDIGANIGGYTMFTAGALGRFTLAVDCYMPNIERIARAMQIQRVQNRVVLVQNALYAKSGEYVKLSNDRPSGIHLTNYIPMDLASPYVVKTIRFDDLLPILIGRGVRAAIIKIDIEGAESYLCETGSLVFKLIDIQMVMMEWGDVIRKTFQKRYQSIVDFFSKHNYVTTDEKCELLNSTDWRTTWPGNIYWIKQINFRKNIC